MGVRPVVVIRGGARHALAVRGDLERKGGGKAFIAEIAETAEESKEPGGERYPRKHPPQPLKASAGIAQLGVASEQAPAQIGRSS